MLAMGVRCPVRLCMWRGMRVSSSGAVALVDWSLQGGFSKGGALIRDPVATKRFYHEAEGHTG